VQDLPLIVTEKDLNDLFDPFGRLDFVELQTEAGGKKSKGFAFVKFKHTNDARDAVRAMNDFELMGRRIKVSHVVDKAIKLQDDEGEGVKSMSRIELMAKLSRDSNRTETKKEVQIDASPSVCILLKNMFDPEEETEPGWEKEVEDEIKQECSKYGEISHIRVDPQSKGHVYMKFATLGQAHVAVSSLNGRFFAGKCIEGSFVQEGVYRAKWSDV
jgi:RNA-binding protein 23/39